MRRALLLALLVLACHAEQKSEKVYELRGKVLHRDVQQNALTVDHEAIPGFMEAMTMDYPVRGANVATLPPDQSRIQATLHVAKDGSYWVTDVRKAP